MASGEEILKGREAGRRGVEGRRASAAVGSLLLRATERLRGSRSLELLRQIEDAPRAPRETVLTRQFESLSRLLAHAEAHVPYYREMFRSLRITSRDVRSMSDFAALPVLTKDIVRERASDLVSETADTARLIRHNSGGSTGVPLSFFHDRLSVDASEAGTYRNLRQCGWRPGEMVAFFWGANDRVSSMSRVEFELRQAVRRMYHFNAFRSGSDDMARWLDRWPNVGATVALGYASTLARFAEYVESTGRSVAPLRGVFTTGEKLYAPQREALSRVFGCHVFDCYGSSEVRNIAAECPRGRMHVNADFVVLEAGPAAEGEPAPFILTSLWNYSMPFIRYRNEDCGALADGACDCGNNFPVMHLDIARTNDNFPLPGGRVAHGLFFTYLMYGSEGIANFQFHQTAPDRITLSYVADRRAPDAVREEVIRRAVEKIDALAPGRVRVEVREVEEIPPTAAGKHRYTRSDVSAAGANVTAAGGTTAPAGRGDD